MTVERPRYGLTRSRAGGKLAYGWKHGHFQWLPGVVQDIIVIRWNRLACLFTGHDDTLWHLRDVLPDDEPIECCDCCTPLDACVGHPS